MNRFFKRRTYTIKPLLLLAALCLCFAAAPAIAQESGEIERVGPNQNRDWIGPLGLTPDQLAKIRMIRQQNQEERRLAGERLRSAQRALDDAIYSDDATEAVIEQRARELAQAQAATIRLRALTELNIRRILTPEQLDTLRALRLRHGRQPRLQRQMNLPRGRRNRQPGNTDTAPALPRNRFRQRENAPVRQNHDGNNRPATGPRQRPDETLRQRQP